MNDILIRWLPYSLELIVVIALLSSTSLLKSTFKKPELILWILISLSLVLTVPLTHRLFFDEDIYLAIGQNMALQNQAQLCTFGTFNFGDFECLVGELNKQPHGLSAWYSLLYRLLPDPHWIHLVGLFMVSFGSVMLFQIGRGLGLSQGISAIAGLLPWTSSTMWQWSPTTSAEPLAFVLILVFLRIAFSAESNRRLGQIALITLAAWLATLRWELGFLSLFMLLFIPIHWDRKKQFIAVGIFGVLLIPHALQFLQIRHDSWGADPGTPRFGWVHVMPNLLTNLKYYISASKFNPLVLLLVIGAFWEMEKKIIFFLGACFVYLFAFYLPFYAGSYEYGADVRFAIPAQAFLYVLATGGLLSWTSFLGTRFPREHTWILSGLFGYMIIGALPYARSVGQEAWLARNDHNMVNQTTLPNPGLVFSHHPSLFLLKKMSSAQMEYLLDSDEKVREYVQTYRTLYYHRNYWCTVYEENESKNICDRIEEKFKLSPIIEVFPGGQRLGIYQITFPN